MSRLRHSERAFLKTLQMSRTDVFVFVEGWTDRYFYDKACRFALDGVPSSYELRLSRELDTGGEGKAALIDFFLYLRRRGLLIHTFKGKKLAVIFFLDKDVDDYLRVQKRSRHVVYTRYYELENHILRHSGLVDAAAAAACLDAESIQAVIGNQEDWLRRAALQWKEWVILCLLTRALGANAAPNYRQRSQVNVGGYGGLIPNSVPQMEGAIQAASGLAAPDFQRVTRRVKRYVDRMFAAGQQDRLFKGKWYGFFLVEDVRRAAAGRPFEANGLERRTLAVASSKLDFAQPWGGHFVQPVRDVVGLL